MPFYYACPDHPEWTGDSHGTAVEHLISAHEVEFSPDALAPIKRTFVAQVDAQRRG